MTALLIGQIKVKNDNLWQEYLDGVDRSLVPFQAHVNNKFRGKKSVVLEGSNSAEWVVIIEFESIDIADRWFRSERYQSLVSLRDQAAAVDITIFDETTPNSKVRFKNLQ